MRCSSDCDNAVKRSVKRVHKPEGIMLSRCNLGCGVGRVHDFTALLPAGTVGSFGLYFTTLTVLAFAFGSAFFVSALMSFAAFAASRAAAFFTCFSCFATAHLFGFALT